MSLRYYLLDIGEMKDSMKNFLLQFCQYHVSQSSNNSLSSAVLCLHALLVTSYYQNFFLTAFAIELWKTVLTKASKKLSIF